jgi:hypothetical protein
MSNRAPISVASDQSRPSHVGNWPNPMGRATGNWPDPMRAHTGNWPDHNARSSHPLGFMI